MFKINQNKGEDVSGKSFKAVIFDLDGTLIYSLDDLADSMNSVLKKFNYPLHETEKYKYFVGEGIRNLVIKALPENNRDITTIDNCFKSMILEYGKNCLNKTRAYNGVNELLKDLSFKKIHLAVLSNKADELTQKTVSKLFPDFYFDYISGLTSDETRKPSPVKALEICSFLKINPHEVAFVGDSAVDMQTAKNAGMFAVGALWGYRTEDELISNGAKHLIKNPMELINLL